MIWILQWYYNIRFLLLVFTNMLIIPDFMLIKMLISPKEAYFTDIIKNVALLLLIIKQLKHEKNYFINFSSCIIWNC